MPIRRILLGIVVLAVAIAAAQHRRWLPAPWDPTQPLDLRATVTLVTPLKKRLLEADPGLCAAALATAPLGVRRVPDSFGACPLRDAVRVSGGVVATHPSSFLASCRLAVDWAMFARDAAALAHSRFGRTLTGIDHLGSYACRDVRGRPGVESSHGRADAIDVSAFVFADGRRLSVSDWRESGADGALLHALRDLACQDFGLVLSPDYNADHAGHLHLQAGGFGLCR
ncbi:hypothetical protein FHR90_001936 [Endobacter medicaginis]|uniref:Extensin-like C-terminal domain-containing protein n=3 Tax=Endobacter medicaginis TaxID=1181271 RepID=A0A839V0Z0_9PROT|nr:hypothetical protein [Endobacter medicaginis]MCX5474144.1 extensin family protein [Endobacter medicaginis]